jgi:hypothetical protein
MTFATALVEPLEIVRECLAQRNGALDKQRDGSSEQPARLARKGDVRG